MAHNQSQSDHSLEDNERRMDEIVRTGLERHQGRKSKEALEQTATWCRRALLLTDPLIARHSTIATKGRLSPGIYEQVIQDNRYRKWLDSSKEGDKDRDSRLLWISPSLGTDATKLSVFLTEELERHIAAVENAELVFFFCNRSKDTNNTSTIVLYGLISQIVTKRPVLRHLVYRSLQQLEEIQEHLEAAQRSERPFEETPEMFKILWDVFSTLIRAPELGTMFCVIHGLDKCIRPGSAIILLLSKIQNYFNEKYPRQRVTNNFMLLIVSHPILLPLFHCTVIRLGFNKVVDDTNALLSENKTESTSRFDNSDEEADYSQLPTQRVSSNREEHDVKLALVEIPRIPRIRTLYRRRTSLSKPRSHICSTCERVFMSKIDQIQHMLRVHNDANSFGYGGKRQGFSSQARGDTDNNMDVPGDNLDDSSAASEVESIFSLASLRYTATGKQREKGEENEVEEDRDDDGGKVQSSNQMPDPVPEVYLPMQPGEEFIEKRYHRTFFSQIQVALGNLFIAAGFLEPPLEPGMVRLRWRCRCGESFFGDVTEYRHNGIHELTDRMSRSTGANITVTSYSKTSKKQTWNFKFPAWARRIAGTFSSSAKATAPNSGGGLPQYNASNRSAPSTSSAPVANTPTSSIPRLHLLACAHRNERRKCLLQDPIDSISTDRALFCFMKQQLRRNHSRIRSVLAMRSIQGMFFVKFRLRMGNNVEVRDHNPCCTSTNPVICECIPPKSKVEPSPDAEYRCSPAGPLATWPPVLSQDLMHMLSSPECIHEDETWVLEQLPKRTAGELQACVGGPAEGWGIYYKEGINFDMITGVVAAIFLFGSLLFGILWTMLEKDFQGAFGFSSWMATGIGIFVACMVTYAKNIG